MFNSEGSGKPPPIVFMCFKHANFSRGDFGVEGNARAPLCVKP